MPEKRRHQRGLLDTSVVIDLEKLAPAQLPREVAISALTMAELAAGPHATTDPEERGRRQDRLQRAEAMFDPLPFDTDTARAYGRIFSAVMVSGRKARGARAVDLLIAATALAAGLPIYTRNGDDFPALEALVEVVVVSFHATSGRPLSATLGGGHTSHWAQRRFVTAEDTLQTPTPDFAPARLDGTEAHLGDGHEGHNDRPTVDDGPVSSGRPRITTGVKER